MFRKAIHYITHWEDWHWFAKYIVIGPVWIWLCIKGRSPWFFTPSNPGISFGGFLGETKKEIYDQLPAFSYPNSLYVSPASSFQNIKRNVIARDFKFPFAVKPDVGMMGLMFRRIESFEQLRQYHGAMEANYIIQDFVNYPIEVSVFYYRFPGEQHGTITGFLKKESMNVTGDGKSTLKQLILNYPRAQFRLKELFARHEDKLGSVIANGEVLQLSEALNLSRGGRLVNLEHEKDERLLRVFDELSHYSKLLYYGRYDIKCASIEDLKEGRNFTILEYNGCGGEPHHVYGNGNSFFRACGILIEHWNVLYRISKINRERGIGLPSFNEGRQLLRKSKEHFRKLKLLDLKFTFADNPVQTRSLKPSFNMQSTDRQQNVA